MQALVTDAIAINQGGSVNPDGSICCDPTAPECKIQTAFEAGNQYFAYTKNLTAMLSASGAGVVTDWSVGKEYQVDSNHNCQAYCPLPTDDNVLFPFAIDPNATNAGSVQCGQFTCTEWITTEVIPILNITMEATDDYVTTINGAPAPVWEVDIIEPLGEQIGNENTTWFNWKDMDGKTFPANVFTVNGAASCPMSNQCQGNDDGAPSNDNGAAPGADGYFARYGVRLAGTNHRSRLFAEVAARERAELAKALNAEIEARLAMVPLAMRARVRALLHAQKA
jgi:hypothetical protein